MRLVLDWDGTVTEVDSLHLVLEEFGDPEVYAEAEARLGRDLTLHETIALEFSSIRAPLATVVDWVREHVRVRPGLRELTERCRPVVLSSGFRELIEPVLARERIELEVLANRLDPRPDGWRPVFRDEARCAACGEACKRGSLPAGDGELVFVGDGFSDRCAALAADRVFARDDLARWLDRRGVAYEPYGDFRDVLAAVTTPPRPARASD